MEYAIPELEPISRLMNLDRAKKAKMLVVDDEPDNLDLLYRTFRRDFHVLKAESGVHALQLLAEEGEVAVIISDQRMPEMKGTEFLSRTVPNFPDTMRIILTGFTDVEDLVEAINAGQVYRYITKPWDPNELKTVVQRAAETYELLKQRTEELRRSQAQTALLSAIVAVAQDSTGIESTLDPIAVAFGQNFLADRCVIQLIENDTLTMTGTYGVSSDQNLAPVQLVKDAIASRSMQVATETNDPEFGAHLVVPVTLRDQVLAVLSLQWKRSLNLREDELLLLHLSARQVALALTCSRSIHSAVPA
ncbi:MAG TPA: response regulator [Leptolyngbya sp.]|jgi:response regulator RpfG family c-di-GMP phosphodiesterase|nr:response regulator [Leptolyngbya sp.]